MAVVTKIYLQEQVQALLAGGDPSAGAKYEPRMVLSFIQQAVNNRLKSEYFSVTLPNDETIPDGLVLATYESIAVEPYMDRSRSKLPAMPVSLRRGMGVYFVGENLDEPFIPLQSGQNSLIKSQNLINTLFGQPAYEKEDAYVVYTKDITRLATPITSVIMKLVVMDFEKYDDYDILPLSAEMGAEIVTQVYGLLVGTPPPDKRVDSKIDQPA